VLIISSTNRCAQKGPTPCAGESPGMQEIGSYLSVLVLLITWPE